MLIHVIMPAVLVVVMVIGLWLLGRMHMALSRRSTRRSNDAANEMTANPPPSPRHRTRPHETGE